MKPSQITAFRTRHKLTQAGLGELLGVSWQTVASWEKGTRAISVPNARLLALFDKFPQLLTEF